MSAVLALVAIGAIALVGFAVFWANPSRIVNRVFFSFSVHAALWLLCVHTAVISGEAEHWVRLASALGACITPHMWLLKHAILMRNRFWSELPTAKWWWLSSAILLVALCYTDSYVRPRELGTQSIEFGAAYFFNTFGILFLYGVLGYETIRQIRSLAGLPRLELQILLLGGTVTAFGVILLMALRAILHETWPIRLQPFWVLTLWVGTVIAITTHRVFDARQIVLVGVQKFLLIAGATIIAFALDRSLEAIGVPTLVAVFVTVGAALWIVSALNSLLQRAFQFYPEATEARSAAFAVARREARNDSLNRAFVNVLKGWGQSAHAMISSFQNDTLRGQDVEGCDYAVLQAMRHLRWATPERLAREKPTSHRQAVARFLKKHALGIVVLNEGSALTLLVGVGAPASRRPFTFPQVTQLIELAAIMESAFERAHFSVKAQHAEQLATVGLLGASLAHEIRNPLVSIKTFVQLLPNHHQDPAFRAKFFRLISDEVGRIDQLTEQLLDLASPRAYSAEVIELHPVLRASLDLVAAKASDKRIDLLTEFTASPDKAYTDPSAAKQVMLNLCFNAIQAVESHGGEDRWIKIETRNSALGLEMSIADSGSGISPEIRPRLFQPFQTTKSSGFGLGLAICSDILANLNASISVDPPQPGRGATFRVTFPCQPSSS